MLRCFVIKKLQSKRCKINSNVPTLNPLQLSGARFTADAQDRKSSKTQKIGVSKRHKWGSQERSGTRFTQ